MAKLETLTGKDLEPSLKKILEKRPDYVETLQKFEHAFNLAKESRFTTDLDDGEKRLVRLERLVVANDSTSDDALDDVNRWAKNQIESVRNTLRGQLSNSNELANKLDIFDKYLVVLVTPANADIIVKLRAKLKEIRNQIFVPGGTALKVGVEQRNQKKEFTDLQKNIEIIIKTLSQLDSASENILNPQLSELNTLHTRFSTEFKDALNQTTVDRQKLKGELQKTLTEAQIRWLNAGWLGILDGLEDYLSGKEYDKLVTIFDTYISQNRKLPELIHEGQKIQLNYTLLRSEATKSPKGMALIEELVRKATGAGGAPTDSTIREKIELREGMGIKVKRFVDEMDLNWLPSFLEDIWDGGEARKKIYDMVMDTFWDDVKRSYDTLQGLLTNIDKQPSEAYTLGKTTFWPFESKEDKIKSINFNLFILDVIVNQEPGKIWSLLFAILWFFSLDSILRLPSGWRELSGMIWAYIMGSLAASIVRTWVEKFGKKKELDRTKTGEKETIEDREKFVDDLIKRLEEMKGRHPEKSVDLDQQITKLKSLKWLAGTNPHFSMKMYEFLFEWKGWVRLIWSKLVWGHNEIVKMFWRAPNFAIWGPHKKNPLLSLNGMFNEIESIVETFKSVLNSLKVAEDAIIKSIQEDKTIPDSRKKELIEQVKKYWDSFVSSDIPKEDIKAIKELIEKRRSRALQHIMKNKNWVFKNVYTALESSMGGDFSGLSEYEKAEIVLRTLNTKWTEWQNLPRGERLRLAAKKAGDFTKKLVKSNTGFDISGIFEEFVKIKLWEWSNPYELKDLEALEGDKLAKDSPAIKELQDKAKNRIDNLRTRGAIDGREHARRMKLLGDFISAVEGEKWAWDIDRFTYILHKISDATALAADFDPLKAVFTDTEIEANKTAIDDLISTPGEVIKSNLLKQSLLSKIDSTFPAPAAGATATPEQALWIELRSNLNAVSEYDDAEVKKFEEKLTELFELRKVSNQVDAVRFPTTSAKIKAVWLLNATGNVHSLKEIQNAKEIATRLISIKATTSRWPQQKTGETLDFNTLFWEIDKKLDGSFEPSIFNEIDGEVKAIGEINAEVYKIRDVTKRTRIIGHLDTIIQEAILEVWDNKISALKGITASLAWTFSKIENCPEKLRETLYTELERMIWAVDELGKTVLDQKISTLQKLWAFPSSLEDAIIKELEKLIKHWTEAEMNTYFGKIQEFSRILSSTSSDLKADVEVKLKEFATHWSLVEVQEFGKRVSELNGLWVLDIAIKDKILREAKAIIETGSITEAKRLVDGVRLYREIKGLLATSGDSVKIKYQPMFDAVIVWDTLSFETLDGIKRWIEADERIRLAEITAKGVRPTEGPKRGNVWMDGTRLWAEARSFETKIVNKIVYNWLTGVDGFNLEAETEELLRKVDDIVAWTKALNGEVPLDVFEGRLTWILPAWTTIGNISADIVTQEIEVRTVKLRDGKEIVVRWIDIASEEWKRVVDEIRTQETASDLKAMMDRVNLEWKVRFSFDLRDAVREMARRIR